MSGHAPEPWSVEHIEFFRRWRIPEAHVEFHRVIDGSGRSKEPIVTSEQAEASARRVVACVNACAGLTDTELAFLGNVKQALQGARDAGFEDAARIAMSGHAEWGEAEAKRLQQAFNDGMWNSDIEPKTSGNRWDGWLSVARVAGELAASRAAPLREEHKP